MKLGIFLLILAAFLAIWPGFILYECCGSSWWSFPAWLSALFLGGVTYAEALHRLTR